MRRFVLSPRLFVSALALSLLLGVGQHAIQAAEAPPEKLVIQSAVYGDLDNDKTRDVKSKVAGMVNDENLSVRASSENFGDPAPGAAKKLKIGYTLDGIYHSKTVDEGETLDISTKLIIRKAVYGNLPKGPSADVTDQVAEMVRKNSLSVKASNDAFGDPAGNVVKKLRVDYTFDGKDKSKTVGENQTLTISSKGE